MQNTASMPHYTGHPLQQLDPWSKIHTVFSSLLFTQPKLKTTKQTPDFFCFSASHFASCSKH